jgi:hypothetical protein
MSTTYTYIDLKDECKNQNNFVDHPKENYVGKFSEMSFIVVGDIELGKLKHFGKDDLTFVKYDGTRNRVMQMSNNIIYLFDYQKTKINMIEVPNIFEVVQERIVC